VPKADASPVAISAPKRAAAKSPSPKAPKKAAHAKATVPADFQAVKSEEPASKKRKQFPEGVINQREKAPAPDDEEEEEKRNGQKEGGSSTATGKIGEMTETTEKTTLITAVQAEEPPIV